MRQIDLSGDAYFTPPSKIGWFAQTFPRSFFTAIYSHHLRLCVAGLAGEIRRRCLGREQPDDDPALEDVGVKFEITGLNYLRQVPGRASWWAIT